MNDEMKTLIETLENSPREPGRVNPDLLGWQTPAGNLLCAHCAGRILARGCRLPAGTRPIWQGSDFVGCTPCAVGS
jgi:hypothetical protein